ncbi:MAG: exopolyphosphatase [Calditrichia bacterium]
MKFAAIDIGSNAVRLLLARVFETDNEPVFKKESLVRIPLRLGEDAFTDRRISDEKADSLIQTMIAFRHLITAYGALDYIACATSAMREAINAPGIVAAIEKQSGIQLEVVDGKKEADIIYSNHFEEKLSRQKSYLYIDVGGGSTELTLFSKGKNIASKSFDIGTVRLLKNVVPKRTWREMKQWTRNNLKGLKKVKAIGSGGNINKIFRLSRQKEGKPLLLKNLKDISEFLSSYSLQERIKTLGLRPDRADVIIPASQIYISVMEWGKIKRIYVPQIGLADGLVHLMYERYKNARKTQAKVG